MMVTNWSEVYREQEAELKAMRDKTIEECARVSEERAADWRDLDSDKGACGEVLELECLDIAAAIRALKTSQ